MRAFLGTALLALALPAAANAETFCVHSPADCSGPAPPTLQAALDAADANGAGEDQIRIGPGTFEEAQAVNLAGSPVEIVGAGPGLTTIQSSTPVLGKVLDIRDPGSLVSQLHLRYTGNALATGIELAGDLVDVRVTSTEPSTTFTGVTMEGTADVTGVRVDVESTPTLLNRALFVVQGADVDIDDAELEAPVGIDVSGGDAVIDRARIRATQGVNATFGSLTEVRDSEVRVRDSSASIFTASAFYASGDGATFLELDRVTAYAEGGGAAGVTASPNGGANSATIDLQGSVLHGFQVAISLLENAGNTVTLTSDWSAYDLASVGFLNSPTYTPGTHLVDLGGVDPQFRDAAGDLRPAHSSPLVDAGDPAFQPAAATTDVLRRQRLRNSVVDIGAHEYQRFAPQATASASAAAAAIGVAIGFDASASFDLDGEPLTYAWSFDDGAAAAGPVVQHAFASGGRHTATVTVTDPSGLSASAAVPVNVASPAGGSDGRGGDAEPAAAVRVSRLRLSPGAFRSRRAGSRKRPFGTTVSYRLSAAARVVFTIERARRGRRARTVPGRRVPAGPRSAASVTTARRGRTRSASAAGSPASRCSRASTAFAPKRWPRRPRSRPPRSASVSWEGPAAFRRARRPRRPGGQPRRSWRAARGTAPRRPPSPQPPEPRRSGRPGGSPS